MASSSSSSSSAGTSSSSSLADSDQQLLLNRLKDVELAAERVLSDKHEVVALDRRRNAAREAARALEAAAAKDWRGDGGKAWVAMGGANCFIKMPVAGAKEMLRKDQVRLDGEINVLRSELKVKVNTLREKEGREELRGFGLKALDKEELSAVRSVIGPKPTWR